jgi:phosphate transport system substrate-binding protein
MLERRLVVSTFAIASLVVACAPAPSASPDPLAGTYTVKGGGAALEVFQALSDAFRNQHPMVRFIFEDVGSAAGMKLAASGAVDLATASATPPPDIASSVVLVPVGTSGTAVVVGATNRVTALTKTQVRDIFAGQMTDWSEVGGEAGKIVVVIREAGSALRSNFDAFFFGGKGSYAPDAIELSTGDEIIRAVTSRPGVISMVTISGSLLADRRIRGLTIDGIAPSKDNITAGRYPVVRPLFLVYSEKYVKPAVADFLRFVRSADGQHIIDLVTTGG